MLKASIIGNLGGDPVLKYTPNGTALLQLSVAAGYTTRSAEGEWQQQTEWVRVTIFGARAESLSQHLSKGQRVYAEGRLEARPWTDQQGRLRAGLELAASEIDFVAQRQDQPAQVQQRQPVAAGAGRGQEWDPDPGDGLPF